MLSLHAQRDITSLYITNATLANGTSGWNALNFNAPQQGNNTIGWATESYAGWGSLSVTSYSLTQTITLPKGSYRLANYSFFRQGLEATTDVGKSLAFLKAGGKQVAVKTLGSIPASGYANTQSEGANCFDSKMYRNVVEFEVDADNTSVEIGLVGTFDLKQSWVIAGMFELFDLNQTPSEDTPTDVTFAITNSGFEYRNLEGWTLSGTDMFKVQDNTSFDNKAGKFYCEQWQASGGLSDRSISQQLTDMPAGYYTLSAYTYYGGTGACLYANDSETTIPAGASGQYSVKKKIQAGQSLTIGLRLKNGTSNWICMDRFTLTYYPVDLTSLKDTRSRLEQEAIAMSDEPIYDEERDLLLAALANVPAEDEDAYIQSIEQLEAAIAAAKQSIVDHAAMQTEWKELIDFADRLYSFASQSDKALLDNLKSSGLGSERAAAETSLAQLRQTVARLEINVVSCATNTNPVDMTWKIINPAYSDGDNGWSRAENHTGEGMIGVTRDGDEWVYSSTYNTYMRHTTVYQEGIMLQSGTYRLSALLKGTPKDDQSTFIYVTDGAVAHWENPVFKGNTTYSYLKQVAGQEWANTSLCFTIAQPTTMRIGILSWGNNWTGGQGGAFCVDNWKLEAIGYPENKHVLGDATGGGTATIRDMAVLNDALRNFATERLYEGADANNDGHITLADVKPTGDAILAEEPQEVVGQQSFDLTVYAQQSLEENVQGSSYMLRQAVNADPASVSSLSQAVATYHITVGGSFDIQSVSLYSKGHEAIAGELHFLPSDATVNMSSSQVQNGYALGSASDVVQVISSGSTQRTFTVYTLPVVLSQGITITVRDTDGKCYSQDYSSLNTLPGQTNTLSFTNLSSTGAWLATIPGDIHFNLLSLPGAHDAGTDGLSSLGKCQSLSIDQLLNAGVKSLDLRPYGGNDATANNMVLYHGVLATSVKFKDALLSVKNYLVAHPSETIFLLIHDEKGSLTSAWQSAVLTCVEAVQDYVKVINGNMLLDDCRGKMVIIARDNVGETQLLGKCGWGSSFNDKTVFYGKDSGSATPWTLVYQDEYNTSGTSNRFALTEKLLSDYIKTAALQSNRIFFNTTNYAANLSNPSANALDLNQRFVGSEVFSSWSGRFGIVSGDFIGDSNYAGDAFLNTVISQNYKYVFQGRSRVR